MAELTWFFDHDALDACLDPVLATAEPKHVSVEIESAISALAVQGWFDELLLFNPTMVSGLKIQSFVGWGFGGPEGIAGKCRLTTPVLHSIEKSDRETGAQGHQSHIAGQEIAAVVPQIGHTLDYRNAWRQLSAAWQGLGDHGKFLDSQVGPRPRWRLRSTTRCWCSAPLGWRTRLPVSRAAQRFEGGECGGGGRRSLWDSATWRRVQDTDLRVQCGHSSSHVQARPPWRLGGHRGVFALPGFHGAAVSGNLLSGRRPTGAGYLRAFVSGTVASCRFGIDRARREYIER